METKISRKSKYSEDEVVRLLSKKKDVRTSNYNGSKIVQVLSDGAAGKAGDLGNKSLGRIDYLVNYCGYRLQVVSKFTI